MPKCATGLLLILMGLSGTGCVHFSTPAERDASFLPYQHINIGEERLPDYVLARSAVVLTGDRMGVSLSTDSSQFYYTNAWRAGAAAIDSRGYFLTAAHCPLQGEVWVVFPQVGKKQLKQARIVWRGNLDKGEPDLAVLCVSCPINQTFQWATKLTEGSPVVDVGLSKDEQLGVLKPQCMGGRILEISGASSKVSLDYTQVNHSSPLCPGDSGGPLVLLDGRLAAINVSGHVGFQWSHFSREREYGTAHRPDLQWLRKVIDADAASLVSSP